ncbi:ABC transporter permease [Anthocerotibacter panamensis]|uniref:ABC transporter permease n=1 Tax=Anthocerotibacter panamensis TaxID=2857077 RepID=UPI001C4047A4|nr:ABC transporter permease [Anthocerotibacter panamensis]
MKRAPSLLLSLTGYGVYLFLYLPVLVIVAYSFNRASYGVTWTGFTFAWYEKLWVNEMIRSASINTLVLAVVSTAIATLLGSLLGYGLQRYRFAGKQLFLGAMYMPVIVPDIILAIALLLFYKVVRQYTGLFELNLLTMVLAHVTFQISFVAIVVRSRIVALDPALEEAARDLYASTWATLRYVTLPLIFPGILAGALLALTLSIDDFVVSFFTSGPDSTTLPILIYSTVRRGVTPEMNALSTVIVLVTMVTVFGANFLGRRRVP